MGYGAEDTYAATPILPLPTELGRHAPDHLELQGTARSTYSRAMHRPWPKDAVRHRLIGDWHIYQRRGGHRTSTDDVVTAWHACRGWNGAPAHYLDLGCGIGSVLLTVAHRLRPARSLGVEAQAESVMLLSRTVAELPAHVEGTALAIEFAQGDLRTHEFGGERFDLITGSPPYFPLGTGVPPADPQRLACRFETRGGVEDYCATAGKLLTDDGRLHLVFQSMWTERVEASGTAAGLYLTSRCDIHSRSDRREPFLTVFEFRRTPSGPPVRETLAVRDEKGDFTEGYEQLRRDLGYREAKPNPIA
ncbi:MAG: methyltransferase domain-containing protein [Myxococcota bacterium]